MLPLLHQEVLTKIKISEVKIKLVVDRIIYNLLLDSD